MTLADTLKAWARRLRAETFALYLAARDPRTPWFAKALAAVVAAYAFSPIDLVPDFVPVLGYLDDLLLVPAGAALAIRLVPVEVMADCRDRATREFEGGKPVSRAAVAAVVTMWLLVLAVAAGLALTGCTRKAVETPPSFEECVHSIPAADWPTGALRAADVHLEYAEADVPDDFYEADAGLLREMLGPTLHAFDASEPGEILGAAVVVLGWQQTQEGADLYVAIDEKWWPAGEDKTETAQRGSSGPARLRLHHDEKHYELHGIDGPMDGSLYGPGLAAIFPERARERYERFLETR